MLKSRLWIMIVVALVGASLAAASLAPSQDKQEEKEHGGNIVYMVHSKKIKNLKSVLYSHEQHLSFGYKCDDCHGGAAPIFEQEAGSNVFTMNDINHGERCGKCHDGKTTWKDQPIYAPRRNCERCHTVTLVEQHAK